MAVKFFTRLFGRSTKSVDEAIRRNSTKLLVEANHRTIQAYRNTLKILEEIDREVLNPYIALLKSNPGTHAVKAEQEIARQQRFQMVIREVKTHLSNYDQSQKR